MIHFVARLKIYLQRTLGYLNLVSAAMLLDLWLKGKHLPHAWYWPALITFGLLALAWGYLEDRLGIFEAETEQQWARSPQLRKIVDALDESWDRSEEKP